MGIAIPPSTYPITRDSFSTEYANGIYECIENVRLLSNSMQSSGKMNMEIIFRKGAEAQMVDKLNLSFELVTSKNNGDYEKKKNHRLFGFTSPQFTVHSFDYA